MKNLKEKIEREILQGELREIKYKNLISGYKKSLKCNRHNCRIFLDFRSVTLFFAKYQKNKEKFFAHLVHDIKSPLMSINFALKNNRNGEIINDVYYTNLESLNLIDNVLALYGKDSELKFSKFDFLKIVDAILRNHKYLLLEKGLEIIFECKTDELEIISCPVCLGRIISNLLSNAIKFSPNNKKIEIKLEFYKDVISISFENEIAKNSKSYKTSGFGLNIAKLLAKKINGKISHRRTGNKVKYTLDFISLQEEEHNLR